MPRNMSPDMTGGWIGSVTLPNDMGDDLTFTGRLVAGDMHFNNSNGMLTVEKVYERQEGGSAYGVISAIGHTRDRRAYLLEEMGEVCVVNNGRFSLEIPTEELLGLLSLAIEAERDACADSECDHMIRKLAAND